MKIPLLKYFLKKLAARMTGVAMLLLCVNPGLTAIEPEAQPFAAAPREGLPPLRLGLFFQTQFYVENHGYGNIYTDTHDDGLRIRRLRPSLYGNVTPQVSYSLQPYLYSDFQSIELGLNNAVVKYAALDSLDLKLGRFIQPFGNELTADVAAQVFPEKSRYWSYLFSKNFGNGIGVDVHGSVFKWQSAFFYSFTDGYTVTRQQDLVTRIIADGGNFSAGLGYYTNFKKFSGSDLPSDIKANFFASISPDRGTNPPDWKLSLEVTGFFKDYEALENAGEGAHISFEYLIVKRLRLASRLTVMYLTGGLGANEISISRTAESSMPGWAFDCMLTAAYYFADQSHKDARQDRMSVSYNPGYFPGGEIAHAMYIEAVIAF